MDKDKSETKKQEEKNETSQFCSNCSTIFGANDLFCSRCGKKK